MFFLRKYSGAPGGVFRKHFLWVPYAPIPSASGLGVGFRYLSTFSQGIWSTRGL